MLLIVKDKLWPSLNYDPHEAQREIHNALIRNRVASCGRRFGKSTIGGRDLVAEAAKTYPLLSMLRDTGKKRRFWIVGPDYSDCEKEFRYLFDDLKRLEMPFDRPGTYNHPEQGNMHIEIWDGAFQVHTRSARHPESLDGEGLEGVELVEAAKLKPFVYHKYIRPALADVRGWLLATSTPEGKNWFYDLWLRGQDPERVNWGSWRLPSWLNSKIFPGGRRDEEILEMELDMSAERFQQEIGADFTEFVGRVFKTFEEETHVRDLDFNPAWPVHIATDYGWSNPFVALFIQPTRFGSIHVLDEYRTNHTDIEDIANALKGHPLTRLATNLYPDPEAPGDSAVLSKRLGLRVQGNTGGTLKWRLELIRKYLKYDWASEGHPDDLRDPLLLIDRKCRGWPYGDGGLIREMQEYRYPDTREESIKAQPENPLDKDNHGPEALGRFFRGYFGGPADAETGGRARVKTARVG